MSAAASGFLFDLHALDRHAAVDGFAHVVDVSAASVTATRASISTPVFAVIFTSA
jgi:hypothetical protein